MAWLEWWNFLFIAPLLAGVTLAVLVVATGSIGHSDMDTDVDTNPHVHDIGDGDSGSDDTRGFDVLGWFGIGRGVSLSLMLPVLLCTFGFIGLVLDIVFEPILRIPAVYAPIATLGALFASSLIGRSFAKAFVRFADLNRKTSIKGSKDLVGCAGTTVFEVDSSNGAANIKDAFGNIHRVVVRTKTSSIAANKAVKVIAEEQGLYIVEESK